jgi:hypothetical protein
VSSGQNLEQELEAGRLESEARDALHSRSVWWGGEHSGLFGIFLFQIADEATRFQNSPLPVAWNRGPWTLNPMISKSASPLGFERKDRQRSRPLRRN